jgi:hypothetical protein
LYPRRRAPSRSITILHTLDELEIDDRDVGNWFGSREERDSCVGWIGASSGGWLLVLELELVLELALELVLVGDSREAIGMPTADLFHDAEFLHLWRYVNKGALPASTFPGN